MGPKSGLFAVSNDRKVPSRTSVNWSAGPDPLHAGTHEVLLGTSGKRLGATKKANKTKTEKIQSRLCPAALKQRVKVVKESIVQAGSDDAGKSALDIMGTRQLVFKNQWAALRSAPSLFEHWIEKRVS